MTDTKCPDCAVGLGEEHQGGCDTARCSVTGLQRLSCHEDHDCGRDVWQVPAPEIPSVKTLLEIHYAIHPGSRHRFQWVASRATYEALLATLAPKDDLIMVVGPEHQELVGIKLRVDDTVTGLYLEWIA